jgi:NAD(P)H-quinone oxidoreductase subunit 4L
VILEAFLTVAAALFAVGLFGALTQQSIVMLMMGLELMINGILLAASAFWYFLAPGAADGQVIVVAVVTAMAIEMAMGFAVVTAIYRARRIDLTDAATELEG